jgi:hypothetical protein
MTLLDRQLLQLLQPPLRDYALAVVGALAVVFTVKFESGSVAAAGVPVLCGVAGLLLRWTAMPPFFLITLCYFTIFPIGLPIGGFGRSVLRDTYFHFDDIILAAAVLVYLHAQYRLWSLVHQAVPRLDSESAAPMRESFTVAGGEIVRLFAVALGCVLIGQLGWLLVTNVELHFGDENLLRLKPTPQELFRRTVAPSTQSAELNRFLLISGFCAAFGIAMGLAFWTWRTLTLSRDDAKMILLDTAWLGARREFERQLVWRAERRGHRLPPRVDRDREIRIFVRIVVVLLALWLVAYLVLSIFNLERGSP